MCLTIKILSDIENLLKIEQMSLLQLSLYYFFLQAHCIL